MVALPVAERPLPLQGCKKACDVWKMLDTQGNQTLRRRLRSLLPGETEVLQVCSFVFPSVSDAGRIAER